MLLDTELKVKWTTSIGHNCYFERFLLTTMQKSLFWTEQVCKSLPNIEVGVNINFIVLHLLKASPVHHVKSVEDFTK